MADVVLRGKIIAADFKKPTRQLDRCALTSELVRDWHYMYEDFFCNLFLTLTGPTLASHHLRRKKKSGNRFSFATSLERKDTVPQF
jgi:hypothetical protein